MLRLPHSAYSEPSHHAQKLHRPQNRLFLMFWNQLATTGSFFSRYAKIQYEYLLYNLLVAPYLSSPSPFLPACLPLSEHTHARARARSFSLPSSLSSAGLLIGAPISAAACERAAV